MNQRKLLFAKGGSILEREIIRLLQKDIHIEMREQSSIIIVFAFAIMTTIATGIATSGSIFGTLERSLLYWIITFFSAMISLSHAFTREEERGTAFFLQLIASPTAIFISKWIFNIILFAFIQLVITACFVFFIEGTILQWKYFLMIAFTGGFALATSATILSAIAAKSSMQRALFPIIAFPILLPVLISGIHATTKTFENHQLPFPNEIIFFLAFSAALFLISILIFPYIWKNE